MDSKQHHLLTQQLKARVANAVKDKAFKHNEWYTKYHLEIVESIASELCDVYPKADRAKVIDLVWLHDYEKIVEFANKDNTELVATSELMVSIGFPRDYINEVSADINTINAKVAIASAPIEIQILSSSDGAAHLVGPFYGIYWHENPDKSIQEILMGNKAKLEKDWSKKMTLPEVRTAFQDRYDLALEMVSGELPNKFL